MSKHADIVFDAGDLRSLTRGMECHDEKAWQTFHEAYFSRLLRYLRVVLRGDEDAAAECVQQTFLRVVRHIKTFDDEPAFWRWLACLARCAAVDYQRSRRRYLEVIEEFDHFMELRRCPAGPPDVVPDLKHAMWDCIGGWRDEDRSLFERKYLEGWSYAELAQEHEISEKGVESRLGRLRQRLRASLLKGVCHEQPE